MDEATVFVSSSLRLIDSWKTTALCFLFPGCFHFFFGPTVAVKCKVPYISNFRNNCASWACLLYLRQTSWLNHNVPHSHFLFFLFTSQLTSDQPQELLMWLDGETWQYSRPPWCHEGGVQVPRKRGCEQTKVMFTIRSVHCLENPFHFSASSLLFSLVVLTCNRTRCMLNVFSLKFKGSETSFLKEAVTKIFITEGIIILTI